MSTESHNAKRKQLASKAVVSAVRGAILGAVLVGAIGAVYGFIVALISLINSGGYLGLLFGTAILGALWAETNWGLPGAFVGAFATSLRFFWMRGAKRIPLIISYSLLGIAALIYASLSWYQNYQDRVIIDTRYSQLCQSIHRHRYETAYTHYMSPKYQQTHTLDEFRSDIMWGDINEFVEYLGCTLDFDHDIFISGNEATLFPEKLDPLEWDVVGPSLDLERVDGEWYFSRVH